MDKNQHVELLEREMVISRVFNAPRDLLWQVWSDCEHLAHWWGPKGWELSFCQMDFRVGGIWRYCMTGPGENNEEMASWGRSLYQEIVAQEKIVSVDAFTDAAGNVIEEMPQMVLTVTFEDLGDKTTVTNRTQFSTAAELQAVLAMGMEQGAIETWDRLAVYVEEIGL